MINETDLFIDFVEWIETSGIVPLPNNNIDENIETLLEFITHSTIDDVKEFNESLSETQCCELIAKAKEYFTEIFEDLNT